MQLRHVCLLHFFLETVCHKNFVADFVFDIRSALFTERSNRVFEPPCGGLGVNEGASSLEKARDGRLPMND